MLCKFREEPTREDNVDRLPKEASRAQVVLAVLAVIAALYLLKTILIPVAFALVVSCMLSPVRELSAPAFSLWTAGCARLARAVGRGRPLPGELDGREPGRGDLHVAVGHRAPRRPGERADHRLDPRSAVTSEPSCPNPGRSTGWVTPTAPS